MLRSVRWRLLVNSLLVSLAAILAVGVVTLVLVDTHFTREEELYLLSRGRELIQPVETILQLGGGEAELRQIASFGLLVSNVRVKVWDTEGNLLADSGSREDLLQLEPFAFDQPVEGTALQFLVDPAGNIHLAPAPAGRPDQPAPQPADLLQVLPAQQVVTQPPIAGISDTSVRLPFYIRNRLAGYLELSEGPALGQVVRDSIQRALLGGSLVALALAALAGLLSARQVTRPLQALGTAANQMAAGDLAARAPESDLAEYNRLAAQFNSMANRLAETIAHLENDRAALRRLIGDASHELRTPLTALKTFNELLSQDTAAANEPAATFIRESGRQLAQLDHLTSGLLDLSRLEARLSGTDFVTGDIRPVVERAANNLRPLSQGKQQRFDLVLPEAGVVLYHDPVALERAVSNLISNAVKYTPAGGAIQVSLAVQDNTALIEVQDNGPGIPEAEQPYLFERFYRGRGQKGQGSGLGLAICQEIAAIHGGRVTFTSREGEGTIFRLQIPSNTM